MEDNANIPLLLVDDRQANLLVLEGLLGRDGYALSFALSGQEALRASLKQDFALVLLDAQMPEMDGFETAELIRANPKTRHLPIIFVSAGIKDARGQFRGYESGAVDYLTKPIEPAILRSKVRVFAELYRQRRLIEENERQLQSLVELRTADLRNTVDELARTNRALSHEVEFNRTLVQSSPAFYVAIDARNKILMMNDAMLDTLGYTAAEVVGKDYLSMFVPADQQAEVGAVFRHLIEHKEGSVSENRVLTRDGRRRLVEWRGRPVFRDGAFCYFFGVGIDVTERREAAEALARNEDRLRKLIDASPFCIHEIDHEGKLTSMNRAGLNMLGLRDEAQIRGVAYLNAVAAGERDGIGKLMAEAFAGKASHFEFAAAGSRRKYFKSCFVPIASADGAPTRLMGITEDITEQKQSQATIAAALLEKEVLLKEIFHRVKNNLQVVSSLLNMQAATVQDRTLRGMLDESANRVRSIAMVHEQLYRSNNLARIDFPEYIAQLVTHLAHAHEPMSLAVPIKTAIDDLSFSVETAVPLGLIVTELISNAYKHAFPDGRRGEIRVGLRRVGADEVRLTVCDDGIGLPPERTGSTSLGLRLVTMLTDQLDGSLEVASPGGAHFALSFNPSGQNVSHMTAGPDSGGAAIAALR